VCLPPVAQVGNLCASPRSTGWQPVCLPPVAQVVNLCESPSGPAAPQPAETCSAPAGCVSSPLHRKRAAPALHTSHRLLRVPPTDCSPCRNHTRGMSPRGAARALEREGKGSPGQWHFRQHCRADERPVSHVLPSPAFPPLSGGFLASAQRLSSSGLMATSLVSRLRQRSEAADVDRRHLVRQRLKDVAVVMGLHRSRPRRACQCSRSPAM